jgi:hypothetical protein
MTNHNSRAARELLRLPPRSTRRHQPAPIDQPIKGKPTFGNSVTAVYSALLRELTVKGKDARFVKTERGKFGLRQPRA